MIKIYEKYLLFNKQITIVKLANRIKDFMNDIYPEYKVKVKSGRGSIWIIINNPRSGIDCWLISLENFYKEIDFTIYTTILEFFSEELFEFLKNVFEMDTISKKLEIEKIKEYIDKLTKDNYKLFINTTKYNL